MTMKLRNPWIDPRVEFVRPEDAQSYLASKGWSYQSRTVQGVFIYFPPTPETTSNGLQMTAMVPEVVQEGAEMERMIDLIATIATYERRFAGDVLNDLLKLNKPQTVSTNGAPVDHSVHAIS